jgi:hypothetical protein
MLPATPQEKDAGGLSPVPPTVACRTGDRSATRNRITLVPTARPRGWAVPAVDAEGVEPSLRDCKTRVLPLALGALTMHFRQ